jgi:hypothetical protein
LEVHFTSADGQANSEIGVERSRCAAVTAQKPSSICAAAKEVGLRYYFSAAAGPVAE